MFALADGSPHALKLYTAPDGAREAKVRAMAAADLARTCAGVAFPQAAAYDADGTFVGFVMPLVEGGHPHHEVCAPASRRRILPNADWRFLVRAALNTARLFGRVHAAGAVVGDVNGSGVLISNRAVASLIDADSFQWAEHACRVATPEYTPPELQGSTLGGVTRTVEHDAFGLAVLLFQLLFLGRHPHAGVPAGREIPLLDAITHNEFAYSRIRSVRLAPPRGTLLLEDLPLGIATLFERAFGGFGRRPGAEEWVTALGEMEEGTAACIRFAGHYHAVAGGACPWCRIERSSGTPAFGSGTRRLPPVQIGGSQARLPKVSAVLARARAEAGEHARPVRSGSSPRPSPAAVEALDQHGVERQSPAGSIRVVPASSACGKRFATAHLSARRAMECAMDEWRTRIGAWTAHRMAADLAEEMARHADAARVGDVHPGRIAEELRDLHVQRRMADLKLSDVAVPGLGERGIGRLAAGGITNAGQLSRTSLKKLPGIGERIIASALLWRDETSVAIRRAATVPAAEIAAAEKEASTRRRDHEAASAARIERHADELARALDDVARLASREERHIAEAAAAFDQAVADIRFLGLSDVASQPVVPAARPSIPTKPAGPAKPAKPAKSGGASCPTCGGAMVRRWARGGSSPGSYFLGCRAYPACTGSRPLKKRSP